MSGEDTQCCLCKTEFTTVSQPRMMPSCEHSACTPCLKEILVKSSSDPLVCQHCGHH